MAPTPQAIHAFRCLGRRSLPRGDMKAGKGPGHCACRTRACLPDTGMHRIGLCAGCWGLPEPQGAPQLLFSANRHGSGGNLSRFQGPRARSPCVLCSCSLGVMGGGLPTWTLQTLSRGRLVAPGASGAARDGGSGGQRQRATWAESLSLLVDSWSRLSRVCQPTLSPVCGSAPGLWGLPWFHPYLLLRGKGRPCTYLLPRFGKNQDGP